MTVRKGARGERGSRDCGTAAEGRAAKWGSGLDVGHIFQGHALNAVDAKGRVSVPASFRTLIEKRALANALDPENALKIGEHKSGDCLWALDAVASAEIDVQLAASVADLPAAERMDKLEELAMDAHGGLEKVTYDSAGRMVLSPMLREFGQIEDLAFFVGAGLTFQIWNPRIAMERLPETSRVRKPLAFLLKERGIVL
jgi:MraZ protein